MEFELNGGRSSGCRDGDRFSDGGVWNAPMMCGVPWGQSSPSVRERAASRRERMSVPGVGVFGAVDRNNEVSVGGLVYDIVNNMYLCIRI